MVRKHKQSHIMVERFCRLCGLLKPLQKSHLIPKFVFDWMKETGSGFLRGAERPNVRQQDGLKDGLLCWDCEQLLGRDENQFAQRVFRPFLKNPKEEIRYDEFFFRFAVSLAWRVLVNDALRHAVANDGFDEKLCEAELEWQKFLLRKDGLMTYCRFHVFLTELLGSANKQPIRIFNST